MCEGEALFACHSLQWMVNYSSIRFMSPQCYGLLSKLPEALLVATVVHLTTSHNHCKYGSTA